jgi:hypothetical protein
MENLVVFEGKRVEIEVDGRRVRGRVVRGPGRKPVLLEDRGTVGEDRDCHAELGMLRIWRPRQLTAAKVVQVLGCEPAAEPRRSRKRRLEWDQAVEIAAGDPARPPADWDAGELAWAEAVHAARRQVARSRKAMLRALKQAAG